MNSFNYLTRFLVVALLAWPLATGVAMAKKGGGGKGQGQGGNRGGSAHSGGSHQGSGSNRSSGNRGHAQSGNRQSGKQGQRSQGQNNNQSRNKSNRSQQHRDQAHNQAQQRQQSEARKQSNNRSSDARQNRDRSEHRAYYGGPNNERANAQRSDNDRDRQREHARSESDRDRDGDRDRDRDRDRNDSYRDRDRNSRADRDDNWRNRIYGDRDRYVRQNDDWPRWANEIRRDWHHGNRNDLPFRYGWWDNHQVDRFPVYHPWRSNQWQDRPYYWWGYTSPRRLTNWLVFNWATPRYWNYGPDGYIYYRDNYVYQDGRRYEPVDNYYREVYDLAHSVPSIDEDQARDMDWQPLGVFAVLKDSESKNDRALQLAVNKQGVLSGTYYNRESGHVHPVEGMVDDQSQRAAWAFADGEHRDVVFETSFYNLTEPECSLMVHFGPSEDEAQIWHMVRLEDPEPDQPRNSSVQSRNQELP